MILSTTMADLEIYMEDGGHAHPLTWEKTSH